MGSRMGLKMILYDFIFIEVFFSLTIW